MKNYTFGVNVNKIKNICASFVNSKSKDFNLTHSQVVMLKFLSDPCSPSQKDISTIIGCDKAQVSRVLQELKDKGLIIEQVDEKDNRKKSYQLTPSGIQTQKYIDEQLSYLMDGILFENFSKEEKQQFFVLLDKMIVNLNNYNKEDK